MHNINEFQKVLEVGGRCPKFYNFCRGLSNCQVESAKMAEHISQFWNRS